MLIWLKALLLVLAPVFLALGVTLPLMRFQSFYLFSSDASLAAIIRSLFDGGDAVLGLVVGLVSVVFPACKLLLVAAEHISATSIKDSGVLARIVPVLSKWSMMDVLLVAIVIFAAKTSGLAEAFTQPGLWFYAGSSLAVVALHALPAEAGRQKA